MAERPRIVLIEDDPEIQVLLKDYLQRNNFRVDIGDGGTALDRIRSIYGDPDLIVLDLTCCRVRMDSPSAAA